MQPFIGRENTLGKHLWWLVLLPVMLLTGCDGSGSAPGFEVSGKALVPLFSVTDSDTNDANTRPISNSALIAPQLVPNPSSIGGYVNRAGTGEPGNSFVDGDLDDYFKVSLKEGQQLLLGMADFTQADLDLYLYSGDGLRIIDSSIGTSQFERLVVPSDGEYLVNVFAASGASNYLLSMGFKNTAAVDAGHRLSSHFVSGDVVAKIDPTVSASSLRSLASGLGQDLSVELGEVGEAQLFRLDTSASGVTRSLASSQSQGPIVAKTRQGTTPEQQAKLETLYAIKALRLRSDVEYAHPNYIKETQLTPNDEFYPLQWHYPLINLPAAWDITTGNSNVIVAVIDSGVVLTHVDLQGKLLGGYDFISDARRARDGDGIDNNPNDEGDLSAGPQGSSFHGTHVAGTVAASSNNQVGVAGVSWDSSIMPIRVTGIGGGTDFDIAQGILFAAGLANISGTVPPRRADIINLSLGGPEQSQVLTNAVDAARNAGVIIIAAAGNSGDSVPLFPASQAGVVSVSAVDANRALAPYSTFGSTIDIAAPGGDLTADLGGDGRPDGVLSTLVDDQGNDLIGYYNGTSMASPHVAGVAALMKAVNSTLTPREFDALLANGDLTQDIGVEGRDNQFGFGLIDARKAVIAANNLAGGTVVLPPAALEVNPPSLNFGAALAQSNVIASNFGGGDLVITGISENEGWLNIIPASVNGAGLGGYTVSVNRSGLEEGVYSANITLSSSHNTVLLPVIMQVTAQEVSGDLGLTYVLLINAETFEVEKQVAVSSDSGEYPFIFNDVPQGRYTLVMGTDMDNDGVICDDGEACGAFPTLARADEFELSSDRDGFTFVAAYLASLPTSQNMSSDEKSSLVEKFSSGQGFTLLRKSHLE